MTPTRVLIADDHAMILEGLAATIGRQNDMTVVAKANDGREAVELWKTHRAASPPYTVVQNADYCMDRTSILS